ncbi:MAG: hypothetical protein L0H26_02115, partial [Microlunatus sp.]|nr:hypothetical protein [Microlunatus sp.]
YTSVNDAARYVTAVVHLAVIQAAAGMAEAAAESIDSLTELREQLSDLPLTEELPAETVSWALWCQARGALTAGDVARANRYADAAVARLNESGLRADSECAYLTIDVDRAYSDARWAAGLVEDSLAHLQAAKGTFDDVADGRLQQPGRLAPALAQRLGEPLFGLCRDLADRLLDTGEIDLGLATRRQLVENLRGLASRDETVRVQLARSLADLARDLRAQGRTEEAELVEEELADIPTSDRTAAATLAGSVIARGTQPPSWQPLDAFAGFATTTTDRVENAVAVEEELRRDAAAWLAAERTQAQQSEQERSAQARTEAEQREAERREKARVEAEQGEADRRRQARMAAERAETERREAERLAAAAVAERQESKRRREERIEAHRLEQERLEAERIAAEREEQERREAARRAADPAELERLELERLEAELAELERVEAERAEAERAELERAEAEQAAQAEAEQAEARRVASAQAELKRTTEQQAAEEETARLEFERLEEQRRAVERADSERAKAEAWQAQRREEERLEAERAEAARLEAARREAQEVRREAQRVERERLEAERAGAKQADAERAGDAGRADAASADAEAHPASAQVAESSPAEPEAAHRSAEVEETEDELSAAQRIWQDARGRGDRKAARAANERVVELLRPRAEQDLATHGPRLLHALEELSSARLRGGDLWGSRAPAKEAKALAKTLGRR